MAEFTFSPYVMYSESDEFSLSEKGSLADKEECESKGLEGTLVVLVLLVKWSSVFGATVGEHPSNAAPINMIARVVKFLVNVFIVIALESFL